MSPVRIWLNRNYATSFHLIRQLRENPDRLPVHVIGSHVDPDSPVLAGCDEVVVEPDATAPDFVDRCLQVCVEHRVQVFLPVAGQPAIALRRDDFRAVGTELICPPAEAVALLGDKAATYRDLAACEWVPPWRSATDLASFVTALDDLAEHWTAHHPLVVKPARGVGADGVRFLTRQPPNLQALVGPAGPFIPASLYRDAVAGASQMPELLVMAYLSGPETSVDVLAHRGVTVAAVPRSKSGRSRSIDGRPELLAITDELVRRYRLDGLINAQFRWFGDRPALLEVNTRPSGGLFQSELAGVNLVWAAVRLALGAPVAPLAPRLGTRYVTVSSLVSSLRPEPVRPVAVQG